MTQDPLMSRDSGIETILQKLTSDQELDACAQISKVDDREYILREVVTIQGSGGTVTGGLREASHHGSRIDY